MLARLSSSDYPALASSRPATTTTSPSPCSTPPPSCSTSSPSIRSAWPTRATCAPPPNFARSPNSRASSATSRPRASQPTTYLAFTLKAAPGLPPDPSTPAITIPAGTQAQSVPAQGQTPQTFETSAAIPAKADWNALPVQTGASRGRRTGDNERLSGGHRHSAATPATPPDRRR